DTPGPVLRWGRVHRQTPPARHAFTKAPRGLQARQERPDLGLDLVPNGPEVLGPHVLGSGNRPLLAPAGAHARAGDVTAPPGHHGVVLPVGDVAQPLGAVLPEVTADLPHEGDGQGVDAARRPGPGAVRLHPARAVPAGETLGHLRPALVLDAHEQEAP